MSRLSFKSQPTHNIVILGLPGGGRSTLARALLARHRYSRSPNAPEVPRRRRRTHETVSFPLSLADERRTWKLHRWQEAHQTLGGLVSLYDKCAGAILVVRPGMGDVGLLREQLCMARLTRVPKILVFVNDSRTGVTPAYADLEFRLRTMLHEEEYPGDDVEFIVSDAWTAVCSDGRDDGLCAGVDDVFANMEQFYLRRPQPVELPLRMWIDRVGLLRQGRYTVATGTVSQGHLRTRQRVDVHGANSFEARVPVVGLRRFHQSVERVEAGETVTALLPCTMKTKVVPGTLLARKGSCPTRREVAALVYRDPNTNDNVVGHGVMTLFVGGMNVDVIARVNEPMNDLQTFLCSRANFVFRDEPFPPVEVGSTFRIEREFGRVGFGVVTHD